MRDRLRNKFFRWMGVTPRDDFVFYTDNVVKVLESFERFSKASSLFSNVVAEKLGIRFDGEKVVEDLEIKSEEDVRKEYSERGMI